jgi:hypothetical protein
MASSYLGRTASQDLSTTNPFPPAYAPKETTRAQDIDDVFGDSHDINLPASEVRAI